MKLYREKGKYNTKVSTLPVHVHAACNEYRLIFLPFNVSDVTKWENIKVYDVWYKTTCWNIFQKLLIFVNYTAFSLNEFNSFAPKTHT